MPASADKCQESFIDLRFELQRTAFAQQDALGGVEAKGTELVQVHGLLIHLDIQNSPIINGSSLCRSDMFIGREPIPAALFL